MQRRFGTRRFSGRSGGFKQRAARMWIPVQGTVFTTVTATTASRIYGLQAPTVTIGTDLSSDPPEDVIVDRLMAELLVQISGSGNWVLALLKTDTTWTPGATFAVDADKRILWHMHYDTNALGSTLAGFTDATWSTPNWLLVNATADQVVQCERKAVTIDIKPKVRLQDGEGLVLVAYEEAGTATFSLVLRTWRMLMHRAGRR